MASAVMAGYEKSVGWQLVRHPRIRAAIDQEIRRLLETEAAPLSLGALLKLVRSDKTADRIKVDAAKILLDRAGYTPPTKTVDDGPAKDLAAMSADELRAFLAQAEAERLRLEAELANRAKPVNGPDSVPDDDDMSLEAADLLA